jgi:uncharacterized protein (TIGR01244 family)
MKPPIKIDDRVSTGGQPGEEHLAQLAASGVRTIINLRRPGEQNQPLDPAAMGDAVRAVGLGYVNIPVDPKNLSAAQLDEVARAMAASPGPCLVH